MPSHAERSAAAMPPLAAIGRLVAKDALLVGWRYAAIAAALYLVYGAALYLNRAVYVVAAPLVGALVAIAIAALDWNKRGEVLLASLPVSPTQWWWGGTPAPLPWWRRWPCSRPVTERCWAAAPAPPARAAGLAPASCLPPWYPHRAPRWR